MAGRADKNECNRNVKGAGAYTHPGNQKQQHSVNTDTKITDLPIDCLKEAFKYLELRDLLNVSETNEQLHKAAGLAFSRKHGKECVILEMHVYFLLKAIRKKYMKKCLAIDDVHTGLRLMRNFGHLISQMNVNSSGCTKRCCTKLLHYINEYCAKSLVKLHLSEYSKYSIFDKFHKPFEKVEKISLDCCVIQIDQIMFNKMFPQMRHLNLRMNLIAVAEDFGVHFPKLEQFDYSQNSIAAIYAENTHLKLFIRLNPQLRIVTLNECWDVTVIQLISEYLNRLEELRISTNSPVTMSGIDFDLSQLRFKSVKKFRIQLGIYDSFSRYTPLFDQLENFTADSISLNDIQNFVERNRTITNLSIQKCCAEECFPGTDYCNKLLQITEKLHSLRYLDISEFNRISLSEAIQFMNKLKHLKQLKFMLNQRAPENYASNMDREWRIIEMVHSNRKDMTSVVTLRTNQRSND